MKKMFFLAVAVVLSFAFVACNSKKNSEPVEEMEEVLTDSIKQEAIAIFELIKTDQTAMVESVAKLSDEKKAIPAKYFMPLEAADNAQTMEQKCALLGCYVIDCQTEKFVYNNDCTPLRHTVIARLAVEANLQSKGEMPEEVTADELNAKIKDLSVEDFKAALENNDADNQVVVLAYGIMELTLNNQAIYELENGYIDNVAIAESYKPAEPIMKNLVKLIELLAPHYESLAPLSALTEKIGAVVNAADEDSKVVAIMDYDRTIREMRGKLNVEVNADQQN
ncbi:MAG: hypothetical protein HUK00_03825 [Bacteroidaceae bacterium]|nr:hypothetical protein [Bacteroidaceae bacterium]